MKNQGENWKLEVKMRSDVDEKYAEMTVINVQWVCGYREGEGGSAHKDGTSEGARKHEPRFDSKKVVQYFRAPKLNICDFALILTPFDAESCHFRYIA